ncbi:MAG: 50S ribosomal protein L17 [Prevotellaceae bacterium]|jgi:large subunit ribosomal protein L17|nr:50S ribosomal protein L17 [Prevotellaceae bacterium]
MRHNKKVNHLSRKSGHRHALLSNMASSLIQHKRIVTTEAKAKALRVYVEPLITKSKFDTTHSRRVVFSYLKDKHAVTELFRTVAPRVADRPGGYTRILKIGFRQGDAADMALIELVDFNEAALAADKKSAKKSTRRSRSKKEKTGQAPVTQAATVESVVEPETAVQPETPVQTEAESDTEKQASIE